MLLKLLILVIFSLLSLFFVFIKLKKAKLAFKGLVLSIIYVLSIILFYSLLDKINTALNLSITFPLLAPITEELFKMTLLYSFISKYKHKDQLNSLNILYISLSMGLIFSLSEHLAYIESNLFLARFLLSTPLHLFSSFFIALSPKLVLFTIIFHSLYNFLLMQQLTLFVIILLAILLFISVIITVNYFTKKKIDYFN